MVQSLLLHLRVPPVRLVPVDLPLVPVDLLFLVVQLHQYSLLGQSVLVVQRDNHKEQEHKGKSRHLPMKPLFLHPEQPVKLPVNKCQQLSWAETR
ncbi:MAG: hypothetical protein ABI651_14205 [Verrucomicrobiota bacterium]